MKPARRYLGAALVGLWFTKQGIKPVHLPARRAIPGFFAGWLANELAFHHLGLQAATTWWYARKGALRDRAGRAGLVVTLLNVAGIAELVRRIFLSRAAMQQALDEALGAFPGPLEEVEAEESRAMRWSQLVMPFPPRHPDVVRTRNVRFARAGGRTLKLDVFRHADGATGRPIIVYVHGGAWVLGYREHQGLPFIHEMVARGWVAVSGDYRLSPIATFPEHLVDVKRAIAWARAHAAEIGGDPGFVALVGNSAGGHLAALAALTGNDPRYQPGFEDADTSIQACVPFYGIYDVRGAHHDYDDFLDFFGRMVMKSTPSQDPAAWDAASPIEQVNPDAPPFLVVHGATDVLAPVAGARAFAERLREVSKAPVGYAELPGTQHAFDVFPSLRTAYILDAIGDFLQRAYRTWRTVTGPPDQEG